jgi:peptidoglycan-associated lipoprotein
MKTFAFTMLAVVLAACSHAQPVAEAAPQPAPVAPPAQAAAPVAAKPDTVASVAVPQNSIYFDYDHAELKPEAKNELADLGRIMARNPSLAVRIEGNCDERGSEEYNIALGQRRAAAAKKYLVSMGAAAGQITTLSYGKDHPKAKGHDEESWRQNRRDDFVPSRATVPQAPVSANP